jgi:segregation and condensation protein A
MAESNIEPSSATHTEQLAVIKGEPLHELPEDLYIPPDALEIFLESFEGPLDLLLYLIKRQNLDILDIPVADITRQYIGYIEMMGVVKIELAAEYLVMAAMLTEIKSRMLMPRPINSEAGEEDPRNELVRRLQEYECFKVVAEEIDALPRQERDLFEVDIALKQLVIERPQPKLDMHELLLAFKSVLVRAERLGHHHIQLEPLSVRERMSAILLLLRESEESFVPFVDFFNPEEGKLGAVVSLLATLELCKEGLLEITQAEPLAALWVKGLES